ncbi:MAG: ATP-binding protein, partial [Thermodesulfobacteriota bacterium]
MKLRKEIQERFRSLGPEGLRKLLFEGLSVPSEAGASLMASLMAGHHILLTGPPGVGKTELAKRVGRLLGERTVVEGCPLNCELDSPSCPWCVGRLAKKEELTSSVLAGAARVHRVSGSAELKAADLVGDFNPQSAIKYDILDLRAFVPGKLLRANGCILLMDFM